MVMHEWHMWKLIAVDYAGSLEVVAAYVGT